MIFDKFVDFNSHCPVCGEPLTLYLQLEDSMFFRSKKVNNTYVFTQFMHKNSNFEDDFLIVSYHYNKKHKLILNFDYSSSKFKEEVIKHKMFFYYVCKEKGFHSIKNDFGDKKDYIFYIYDGCYYRSTPIFSISKNSEVMPEKGFENIINEAESFAVNNIKNDIENVYIIHIDYKLNSTAFFYYTVNEEQAKNEDYVPNVFEKEFSDLLTFDLSIDNRDKLISRFNSWVLLS